MLIITQLTPWLTHPSVQNNTLPRMCAAVSRSVYSSTKICRSIILAVIRTLLWFVCACMFNSMQTAILSGDTSASHMYVCPYVPLCVLKKTKGHIQCAGMSWQGVISLSTEPGFSLLSPEKTPLLSHKQQMLLLQQNQDGDSNVL